MERQREAIDCAKHGNNSSEVILPNRIEDCRAEVVGVEMGLEIRLELSLDN
jgi:hypothetical protein